MSLKNKLSEDMKNAMKDFNNSKLFGGINPFSLVEQMMSNNKQGQSTNDLDMNDIGNMMNQLNINPKDFNNIMKQMKK